jgi:hypothetical protein
MGDGMSSDPTTEAGLIAQAQAARLERKRQILEALTNPPAPDQTDPLEQLADAVAEKVVALLTAPPEPIDPAEPIDQTEPQQP